jgi:uncharacterized protein YlzI (FlbEa/FlbD family)
MEFTQEQKVYAEVVQRAWDNAEFKKELIANPLEAIEKLTGTKLSLPEGKTLVVRDQTDESVVYINIPAEPKKVDDLELTEDQLEVVAGGKTNPGLTVIFPTIIFVPSPTIPEQPSTNY